MSVQNGADHPPFLVVGADSHLGRAVRVVLESQGLKTLGTSRREGCSEVRLDLADDLSSWRCPVPVRAAVFCAGVTRLDACEINPDMTAAVNVKANLMLAKALLDSGTYVLFLSTNQVFDGTVPAPPADAPYSPRTQYGRQKAEVESRLLAMSEGTAGIARLTKVITPGFPLFDSWARSLSVGEPVRPFSDMVMAPVPTSLAAGAIAQMLVRRVPGVVQVSADRDVTYAEVAYYLSGRLRSRPGLVRPVTTTDAGHPRLFAPAHTTLDTTRLRKELNLTPPDVWSAIDESLAL